MSKLNWCLCFVLCFCLWSMQVNSSLSTMRYRIVFEEPSLKVIAEKKRIVNLYRELSYGVNDEFMFDALIINKELFMSENIEKVDVVKDMLIVYLNVNGELFMEGNFENVCESEIVKKSWINTALNK